MSEPELHTPEAHDVIACELTACVLGQRGRLGRPELRVGLVGIIARLGQGLVRIFDDFLRNLSPGQRRMLEAAAAAERARKHQRRELQERAER